MDTRSAELMDMDGGIRPPPPPPTALPAAAVTVVAMSLSPVAATPATAHVVVLTLNDVYELFPTASGQGGAWIALQRSTHFVLNTVAHDLFIFCIAEFATLLREAKACVPRGADVVVTLNGDFLWRSELDREDKGALMIDVLNALEIEFVVLGNHEFDFGAPLLSKLLANAHFTSFGSNIRQRYSSDGSTNELFPGLVDFQVLPLANGLKLGLFGVSTTATGKDSFAGDLVVFEDIVDHAQRCVAQLRALGADVVIALTHLKVAEDKALAAKVPGIHLILGGHDHEVMTFFKRETLICKSGQDALWLGRVDLHVRKTEAIYDRESGRGLEVEFEWQMLCNRGFEPDPMVQALVAEYSDRVHKELKLQGKLEPIAISRTMLDGLRTSCRTQESNLGNLIADALRQELHADVGVLNAGFIKGDRLHDANLEVTPHWLEKFLPLRKPCVVVEMTITDLKRALTQMLKKFPNVSSSFPQISGCKVEFDGSSRQLTSFSLTASQEPVSSLETEEGGDGRLVRVATALVPSMDGWEFFERGTRVQMLEPRLVRDVLSSYLKRQGGEIAYPSNEKRLVIQR